MSDPRKAFSMLDGEIRKAMAESLGFAGERLERATELYTKLRAELGSAPDDTGRERLELARRELIRAREWLIIQREALGILRHEVVDERFPLSKKLVTLG